ncbi:MULTISPECIES: hypothetical protein [unclassified Variovorax]|uniref:hypothetical protein n=1 Tax=unclassified Variovorax TaxID=663243 RepID=UPI0008AEB485|nr:MULTISPECIES: hypothetical protein [unclassified Variovorax]SEJ50424.1 hypothetical protein SAMN05518853_102326 [Variovorax sp. OK202]SFC52418.1 hypothetical protein SAMN05444746_102326 [Variovorax sp. OK212]
MATKEKQRAPASTSPSEKTSADDVVMTVGWPGKPQALRTSGSREIDRQALWWNYALLNRERWQGSDVLNVAQQTKAVLMWGRLFHRDKKQSAPPMPEPEAPVVEVTIRYTVEDDNWQYRVMPWEFVLNSVIRANRPHELRELNRLPAIRRLDMTGAKTKAAAQTLPPGNWKVLIVLSAPGFISRKYTLKSELDNIKAQLPKAEIEEIWTPKFKALQEKIAEFRPDIVHFAGCDTHQARALAESNDWRAKESEVILGQLGECGPDPKIEGMEEADGYAMLHEESELMHGTSARIACVSYMRLPDLFKTHKPALVCWNLYHSANRIAALTVGEAHAGASIGFQDFIDDELAEEYFKEFYKGLAASRGRVAVAHVRALKGLWRLPESLRGSGIVLWSHESRLEEFNGMDTSADELQPTRNEEHEGGLLTSEQWECYVKVPPGLNYAQLHQKEYPFENFRVFLKEPLILRNMNIEVRLNGEDRELVYRHQFDIEAPFIDLRSDIEFPLTSPLARSCGESVVTTLYVKLTYGAQVLLSKTYRTRLLPTDQWRFSIQSAHTLASFIFPRDPEVEALVLKAQKYVRVLRDDATAGFEGYQADSPEAVDLQVRALWSTLVHEYRLGYINPPPAYSKDTDSQRLRTPTMVLKGGWGTCIDLALLLAAALELVDIQPVILVLKAHAFVGYWRSMEGRDRFLEMTDKADAGEKWSFLPRRPIYGMFLSTSLREIQHYIDTGELVTLESTLLTMMGGFDEAIAHGQDNLSDPQDFDYMIDLASARTAQITPLPLNFA